MRRSATHFGAGGWYGCLGLAGMVALTGACASGGGRAAPPLEGPEAEALFADLTGTWVLDEEASSPPMIATASDVDPVTPESFVIIKRSDGSGEIIGTGSGSGRSLAGRGKTLDVLARRPLTLVLTLDAERLVYAPTPGQSVTVRMNGTPATQQEGGRWFQTRVVWDDSGLALEHTVNPDDRVHVVMEVVDGQLKITRSMQVFGSAAAPPPLVLVYGRDEGGS